LKFEGPDGSLQGSTQVLAQFLSLPSFTFTGSVVRPPLSIRGPVIN